MVAVPHSPPPIVVGGSHTARPRSAQESNATEGSITLLPRGALVRGGFGYGVCPWL